MSGIDLRSDTSTLPSAAMRKAMASAEVGDDGNCEDPTVNRLQEVAAERFGKEAGLFVSSGTMGDLLGVLVNTTPGDEIIAEVNAHIVTSELAGAARIGGVLVRQIATDSGIISASQLAAAVRPKNDPHQPITSLVCVENTHGFHGGIPWPLEDLDALWVEARRHGLAVHMDGARIFNAALAVKQPVSALAARADTVTFCLSKGLGCPAGSIFLGSNDQVTAARRWRQMLGGGMRQVGVLAAAGLVALDLMVDRLAEDHANAHILARGLSALRGVECDAKSVRTNIVIARLTGITATGFVAECGRRGLLLRTLRNDRVRFVTHYGISQRDIERALEIVGQVLH